jgi:hypothetical protein
MRWQLSGEGNKEQQFSPFLARARFHTVSTHCRNSNQGTANVEPNVPERKHGRSAQRQSGVGFRGGIERPSWGNGEATAVLFAREGARVFAVDINLDATVETKRIIEADGGICEAIAGDVRLLR